MKIFQYLLVVVATFFVLLFSFSAEASEEKILLFFEKLINNEPFLKEETEDLLIGGFFNDNDDTGTFFDDGFDPPGISRIGEFCRFNRELFLGSDFDPEIYWIYVYESDLKYILTKNKEHKRIHKVEIDRSDTGYFKDYFVVLAVGKTFDGPKYEKWFKIAAYKRGDKELIDIYSTFIDGEFFPDISKMGDEETREKKFRNFLLNKE